MPATARQIENDLRRQASPVRAKSSLWFFKTGPGEYGAHDRFLGVTVPQQRAIAKKYRDLPLAATIRLLRDPYHECRLTALFILVHQYTRGEEKAKQKIVAAYLQNTRYVNNWDLVDSSASYILGMHLLQRSRTILTKLAKSKNLWERRIAIIATMALIDHDEYADTIRLANMLLHDEHDLIHKAVGWMLREVGNRDVSVLRSFLRQHAKTMPRTMLRYAIEHLPPAERQRWMT